MVVIVSNSAILARQVRDLMSKLKAAGPHPRHTLLLYARLFSLWRLPALVAAAATGAAAWWAPGPLAEISVRFPLAALSALSLAVFIYALVGPSLSYVQCRPTHLMLSTPLFRMAISYNRIRTTRPVPFDPVQVPWSDQRLVEPFREQTQIAIDLSRYPIKRRWLRFFLIRYMLPNDFVGLLFLVRDWMGLSRNLEAFRVAWQSHQRDKDREEALTSLTGRKRF